MVQTKPKSSRSTADIDRYVAAKIRGRRVALGLTQQQFVKMIGITYQQVHKYEHGVNRISAGRLYEIARILNTPINYFFDGAGEGSPLPATSHSRMLLEITRNFGQIRNEKHQEAVSMLARTLAGH